MIKPVLHTIILLFIVVSLKAQENLVPNPSFDEYTECPDYEGQLNYATGWFKANLATSDYMNLCATYIYNTIPQNAVGYQYPKIGNGYAHSINFGSGSEYMECRLSESLKANKLYLISVYVSLTETSQYWVEKLGIRFTKDTLYRNDLQRWTEADAYFEGIKNDTANWQCLTTCYLAKGGEQFLTIGMFDEWDNYIYYPVQPAYPNLVHPEDIHAGYYWDDISVVESDLCKLEFTIPNVVTANSDGINDFFKLQLPSGATFTILNRWGNIVYKNSDSELLWPQSGEKLTEGVYFYVLEYQINNKKEKQTGFIQLIR
ncbi:gliding motility-associated C-terminal domain-containing protein [Crocinitomicaceae bacterium CZZ-1]|uniref:Gliding motility-associated C-terminal domain-containing protein n=1 Tax=Taishania pollutisoli TaxID=2766479 RepID=A0A8J6P527_9FLAO|nr:gliding motility-associated C-terminal domain-containing protein [Taishania pollutisoli]MBC9811869.1 gliding motility-associated C-terminal domain-containing protein [Taishania pollutisoli]